MDLQNYLFGPMSRDWCVYFYVLSVIGFLWLFFYAISALFIGITKKKDLQYWLMAISISLGYFIFYAQNRLLHSMCTGTIGK